MVRAYVVVWVPDKGSPEVELFRSPLDAINHACKVCGMECSEEYMKDKVWSLLDHGYITVQDQEDSKIVCHIEEKEVLE